MFYHIYQPKVKGTFDKGKLRVLIFGDILRLTVSVQFVGFFGLGSTVFGPILVHVDFFG